MVRNSFRSSHEKDEHQCALLARLHCICTVSKSENVSISYIPTSGLDCGERQQRLLESYNFACKCEAYSMTAQWAKEIYEKMALPEGTDISIIRQMQFICNQQLLDIQRGDDRT